MNALIKTLDMDLILKSFDIIGYVSTGIVVVATIWAVSLFVRGIAPALLRLGNGLARRKIAIFAKHDMARSLTSLLVDSGLFRKSNLITITDAGDIGKSEQATLFLVYWPDWTTNIADVLSQKADATGVIVYAPQEKGPLPADVIAQLNGKRNAVLCNFRGRLINDVVVSLISTSYEKK